MPRISAVLKATTTGQTDPQATPTIEKPEQPDLQPVLDTIQIALNELEGELKKLQSQTSSSPKSAPKGHGNTLIITQPLAHPPQHHSPDLSHQYYRPQVTGGTARPRRNPTRYKYSNNRCQGRFNPKKPPHRSSVPNTPQVSRLCYDISPKLVTKPFLHNVVRTYLKNRCPVDALVDTGASTSTIGIQKLRKVHPDIQMLPPPF